MQVSHTGGSLAVSPLQLANRKAQDCAFAVAIAVLFVATVGIVAGTVGTSSSTLSEVLADCTNASSTAGYVRAGLLGDAGAGNNTAADHNTVADLLHAAPYLFVSFCLAVLFGIVWMTLLRFFAKPVVYATLIIKGVILIGLGAYLSMTVRASCGLTEGDCTAAMYPLLLCAFGALYFLWLCCARSRIEQTAMLLEQSVVVVSTHPGLFLVSGGLLVVKALGLLLCVGAYILLLGASITLVKPAPGQCEIDFQLTTPTKGMLGVVTVFLYWSVQFWLAVRFYVTALTTGIWYYENESLAAQEGELAAKDYTRAPIRTALKHAFTSALGTIAFASLIITICEALKRMAQKQRQNGLVGCLIACCIVCILNYLEFLTRFALVYAALTGEGFCSSGRNFMDSCSRHGFLKVLIVDYMASITLNFGALVVALLVAAITVGLVQVGELSSAAHDDRTTVLLVTGGVALVIASAVLVFICSLLLNVVDAAYSCVVLDLDNHARVGTFHRPAIATVVLQKTKPDFVVVQPGGYGATAYAIAP